MCRPPRLLALGQLAESQSRQTRWAYWLATWKKAREQVDSKSWANRACTNKREAKAEIGPALPGVQHSETESIRLQEHTARAAVQQRLKTRSLDCKLLRDQKRQRPACPGHSTHQPLVMLRQAGQPLPASQLSFALLWQELCSKHVGSGWYCLRMAHSSNSAQPRSTTLLLTWLSHCCLSLQYCWVTPCRGVSPKNVSDEAFVFFVFSRNQEKWSHWPGSQSTPRLHNCYNLCPCARPSHMGEVQALAQVQVPQNSWSWMVC